MTNRYYTVVALIGIIAALVFIPSIGNCNLFDWDEVNFAECAREMVVSGDYSHVQLNFRPFWEKPPFFIWLQAISMNIFGVNEFAARFPNAVCSIVTLVSLFVIGKKFHSQQFGITWVLLYASTLLPHLYFKSGLIDPWFNLFILLSVYHCINFINNPTGRRELARAALAGLFLGLAVLTKGPAALVIVAGTVLVFHIWTRKTGELFSKPMLVFIASSLLVSASWFLIEWAKGNGHIIKEFVDYQVRLFQTGDAGHGGPFAYHFIVLLLGCFPASIIFIASYFKFLELTPFQRLFRKVFISLFWVVLLLFSFAQTKIIHYSSLCYFPLTLVATIGLVQYSGSLQFRPWVRALYWIIAALFSIAFTAIGFTEQIKDSLIRSGIIADEFARRNLQADVHWSGFEFLNGLVFLAGAALIYYAIKNNKRRLLIAGLVVNLVFINVAIATIIPKVELYSQHAAIDFYRSCAGKNVDIETHGFKSYAYIFYSNRTPHDFSNPHQVKYINRQLDVMEKEGHSRIASFSISNMLWMEHGIIDRPAFIVVKTPLEADLASNSQLHKLYSRNGYSFYVRMPAAPAK